MGAEGSDFGVSAVAALSPEPQAAITNPAAITPNPHIHRMPDSLTRKGKLHGVDFRARNRSKVLKFLKFPAFLCVGNFGNFTRDGSRNGMIRSDAGSNMVQGSAKTNE
jgi:hypothetical protein